MGKRQWLLCKVAGDAGTGAGDCHNSSKLAGKSRKRPASHSSSSSGGCISAIFQLFDVQHHHFPFQQAQFISDSFTCIPQEHNFNLKGVEAPRNSLELEGVAMVEEAASSSSSSSKPKQEINLNIPMGDIQMIKTKRSSLMDNIDLSSECSISPGTKTPNLVARLMGLDLLPENSSPRPSLSSPRPSSSSSHAMPLNPLSKLSSHKQHARSLPATPRPSTEYHHRLSLQINNKENNIGCRRSELVHRRDDEINKSDYAKQIAKQVLRESIHRRVGADITNNMTVKKKEQRRDECLVLLKPRRPSPAPATATATVKQDEPRLRLLEIKNNFNKPISNSTKTSPLSSTTELIKGPPLMKKCKKIESEKYDLRLKKMNQQEEPFVKKCNNKKKSTPLSNQLVNVNTKTKFISFKKDIAATSSPSSTAILPQKQLPSCQSRSYNTKLPVQDNGAGAGNITGVSVSGDFEYISRILSHSGIDKNTPISVTHWYSPSHPLHPSIFHHLEKLLHPAGACSGNRKLIFDVVDELLVGILKPFISFKPWAAPARLNYSRRMLGSELIGKLREEIQRFPAADCRILEDIDGLIEIDMKSNTRLIGTVSFEEEAEELVREIERDMVDTLVSEMAVMRWHVGYRGKV